MRSLVEGSPEEPEEMKPRETSLTGYLLEIERHVIALVYQAPRACQPKIRVGGDRRSERNLALRFHKPSLKFDARSSHFFLLALPDIMGTQLPVAPVIMSSFIEYIVGEISFAMKRNFTGLPGFKSPNQVQVSPSTVPLKC